MSGGKPVRLRDQAGRDIEEALAHYVAEDAMDAAQGFLQALDKAYAHLARQPGTGTPRHGDALALPGLRGWRLTRYPYWLFYVEQPDQVEIWRVLHGQRDLPAQL